MKVRGENLGRSVAVEDFYKHGDYAFYDDGVGVGGEIDLAVALLGVEPHTALTPFDKVLRGLVAVVDGRKGIAQIYNHGVAVHPVLYV